MLELSTRMWEALGSVPSPANEKENKKKNRKYFKVKVLGIFFPISNSCQCLETCLVVTPWYTQWVNIRATVKHPTGQTLNTKHSYPQESAMRVSGTL